MARKKDVIKCGCRQCSWGMHHSSYGKAQIKRAIHSVRRTTKQLLTTGEYEKVLDVLVSAGYTD